MIGLFRERKEISTDLSSYARAYLFAGIPYYKKWYQLPKIKKIGISNTSFIETTSGTNIANSSNRVIQHRLFLRFYDTKETLTLLRSKNLDDLKEERRKLHDRINTLL